MYHDCSPTLEDNARRLGARNGAPLEIMPRRNGPGRLVLEAAVIAGGLAAMVAWLAMLAAMVRGAF
jgi:hypothetical protein